MVPQRRLGNLVPGFNETRGSFQPYLKQFNVFCVCRSKDGKSFLNFCVAQQAELKSKIFLALKVLERFHCAHFFEVKILEKRTLQRLFLQASNLSNKQKVLFSCKQDFLI